MGRLITAVMLALFLLIPLGLFLIIDTRGPVCRTDTGCSLDCVCPKGSICIDDRCRFEEVVECWGANCCGDVRCSADEVCIQGSCQRPFSALCGNQVCEAGEDSANCCLDCGCPDGETCDNTGVCITRGDDGTCGDGICDFGENVKNCCTDCRFCEPGTVCDPVSKRCTVPLEGITEGEAIHAMKAHLFRQGYEFDWVNSFDWQAEPWLYEGRPAVMVCNVVRESECCGEMRCGIIAQDGEFIEEIQFW